jgi:chromosome segregation ATPase
MAEKTVGDILKEQGVISDPQIKEQPKEEQQDAKISFFGEIKIKQLVMDIEKIKAEIEGLREVKFNSDQRIKELAESTGELRSILFQKDTIVKELETKIRLMSDSVNDIEPKKIAKDFQKQQEEIQLSQAKTEKVESMYKDMNRKFEETQKILEGLRNVENLKTRISEMEGMISKSIENKEEVDRLTNKTEKIYTELEGKIKEIDKIRADLQKMDDLSKEMTKSIDEINIKIVGSAKKEDVEGFRDSINDLLVSNKENFDRKIKEIEDSINIPKEEVSSKINDLERKKEGILNLLSSLEEQYRAGSVKKETFQEVSEKNSSIIRSIEEELANLEEQRGLTLQSLPSVLDKLQERLKSLEERTEKLDHDIEPAMNIESRTYVLENEMESIRQNVSQVSPEKMAKMTNAIGIQTEIVNDILAKLKEVNRRLMDAKVNLSDYENRTRFFEILNILVRVRNTDDIYTYLSELQKIVFKMRLDKLWSTEKQILTQNLFMELSENWHELGRDDISKMFVDFSEKIKTPEMSR